MSAVARLTATVGALAGTISTSADAVTKGVNVLSAFVDMGATYVQAAKERQVIATELEMEDFEAIAILKHQEESARIRVEITNRLSADPALAKAFNELDGKYEAAKQRIRVKLGKDVAQA